MSVYIEREDVIRLLKKDWDGGYVILQSLFPVNYTVWEGDLDGGEWDWAVYAVFDLLSKGFSGHVDAETSDEFVYIDLKGSRKWVRDGLERERKIRLGANRGKHPTEKELWPEHTKYDKAGTKEALAKLIKEWEEEEDK